jgi:UDP-glucose 4-epimerase
MSPATLQTLARSEIASPYRNRQVIVTGGAGFIGGHLVRCLIAAGARVRVLDDLSSGAIPNLPDGVDFIHGSIEDESLTSSAICGCSHVFHLAAMVSVPMSVTDPEACFRRNVHGTESVLRAAARAGAEGLIHTSSSAVYGGRPSLPSRETDPIECQSPYAASKACGEFLVQAAANSERVPGVSLRLFNVFGPRQNPNSSYAAAVCAFVEAAVSRQPLQIFGDGKQTRDFVPVFEVIRAFLLAGNRAKTLRGQCFNVGLGRGTSIDTLARFIRTAAGNETPLQYRNARAGDVQHSCACLERSRRELGFSPVLSLEAAVRALVEERSSVVGPC